jgi:membrane peptidoglycan carboxypeptidase
MASRLGLRQTMASNMQGNKPDPKAGSVELRASQTENFKSKGNWAGNASFTLSPAPVSTLELANVAATLMSGGTWCPPSPLLEVLDRNGKTVDVAEQPCEQAVQEGLANTLVTGLSKDVTAGTAQRAASAAHWTRPMLGKTGTTQEHKSAGFVGATPQLAGAVLTFNDSPRPRPICDDPTRLCGSGNIFGGKTPAQTWFEAMNPIMAGQPEVGLPDPDPRYLNGGDGSKVPNVIGKSQQEATQILQDNGFKVVARPKNDEAKKGTVVGQSPRGNALAGATVTIQVSSGIPPTPTTESAPGGGGGPPPGGGFPGNGNGRGGNGGGGGGGGGTFPPLEPWITIPNPRP